MVRVNGPRIGSLFSGSGQLDEGVRAVIGGTVAWHAEIEPAAVRVLDHRYPGVPNLGDVSTVDWASVEPVDVLTAGYPCQPFSDAGLRRVEEDARYLWPQVARCIRVLRPRLVVLENVRGHLVRGFTEVLGSLAQHGFDADWTTVRASDVGAPHKRERLFVVAWPADTDGLRLEGRESARRLVLSDGSTAADATHATHVGHERGRRARDGRAGLADGRGVAADADRDGLESVGRLEPVGRDTDRRGSADVAWGVYEPAIRRWERVLDRPAPAPTETGPKGGQRLSPKLTEWMMGWPDGWVTDVPGVSRNEALKLCGNGVVPQQSAEALRRMLATAESEAVA